MIIKKKYTTVKKTIENPIEVEEAKPLNIDIPIEKSISVQENKQTKAENIQKETEESKDITQNESEEKEVVENEIKSEVQEKKKKIDDLDLSLENINFEARAERREGTRRRGYRRTQDRNIVSRAQKDAISIKDVARKEGYNEGIENSKKDLEELKNKLSEFFTYKDEVFDKVSTCILDISVEIAEKIIKKEVETDKEYIIPIIKGVVEEINKVENNIILKVMPKDVEIVRDNVAEIFEGNSFEAKISVIPDKDIKDGGVVVQTSNGLIDATIETQLAIIEKALKKQES